MIILARHGQSTSNNITDDDFVTFEGDNLLTSVGESQAVDLANSLLALSSPTIVSSPLVRARATAEQICGIFDVDYEVAEPLAERYFNFESGVTGRQSRERQALAHQYPSNRIEGAESVVEFHERVSHWFDVFLRKFVAQSLTKSAVLVSHGGPIEVIMMHMLRIGADKIGKTAFRCDTGHMHVWRLRTFSPQLKLWSLEAANVRAIDDYLD